MTVPTARAVVYALMYWETGADDPCLHASGKTFGIYASRSKARAAAEEENKMRRFDAVLHVKRIRVQ